MLTTTELQKQPDQFVGRALVNSCIFKWCKKSHARGRGMNKDKYVNHH